MNYNFVKIAIIRLLYLMSHGRDDSLRCKEKGESMEISKWSKALWLFALAILFSMTGCSDNDSGKTNPSEPSDYLTWMTECYSDLEDKTLKDIVIPGSHDSGMSVSNNCYTADTCNTKAQLYDVQKQLNLGVRYLDIRPVKLYGKGYDGEWLTAHGKSCGSHGSSSWVGCMGERLGWIFDDIGRFLSGIDKNNKELIIVNLSHCYKLKTHTVFDAYCDECDSGEWDEVYNEALSKLSEYMLKCPEDFSVESTPYGTLMQGGGNIILRVENDSIPTDYSQGIINANDFPIYNSYANTLDLTEMLQDQFCKFTNPANHDNKLFLLSYTLTLDSWEAAFYSNVPNIIYTDASNCVATQAAIQLNTSNLKPPPEPPAMGYWILRNTGYVQQYGKAICFGRHPSGSDYFVDMAVTPTGRGYWLMTDTGGINAYGDAVYYGHNSGAFVAMAATPTGKGYWLMTDTGGINCYGDAGYYGHHSGGELFTDMAVTPTGKGYWLMSDKGGIDCYGDAEYYGHHPSTYKYFEAMAATPTGKGYWLMTDTGGINCYGDAVYYGHHPNDGTNVEDMAVTPTGKGYWIMTDTGGIDSYGDAIYYGHELFEWTTAIGVAP